MNFLVDAQLPRRLATIIDAGHHAIHTLDLPHRNRTPDAELLRVAEREDRILVTKDADFVNSFHVNGRPWRLLLISTGNIANRELERLVLSQLPAIVSGFSAGTFLELTRTALVVHT